MSHPDLSRQKMAVILPYAAAFLLVISVADGLGKYSRYLDLRLSEARSHWAMSSAILSRSSSISADYEAAKKEFSPLWQEKDPAKLMDQLDQAARAAGVAVDNIRPAKDPGKEALRFELNLRGSWPRLISFFRAIEGREYLFDITGVNISRRNAAGELGCSILAQRRTIR